MTPTLRLLVLVSVLAALALAAALLAQLDTLWKAVAAIAFGGALLDLFLGRQTQPVELERKIRHSIPVGVWSQVQLSLVNRGERSLCLRVHDHHPEQFEVDSMPREFRLRGGRSARISYRVRPKCRGDGQFVGADLVITSPLGLWWLKHFLPLQERVRVFPNFRDISHYALLATDHHLSQIGIRQRRRRGEGSDFHQLREYRFGDSLRQIDWKATSRMRKLISKDYQDERDQQVVFLLDCGRRMRHAEDGRAHLDQALNALVLLAYVAVRQGDAVGFMAFGGTRRWYSPRKGDTVVRELLYRTYDLDSSLEAADYLTAVQELMSLQARRALIIVLTNTRDEDHQDLRHAVGLLAARHLVVVADLREDFLDETLRQPVRDLDSALRFQAVNGYLTIRASQHELLHHHGALILDLLARQLPIALVNQYLTIKATGVL